MSFIIEIATTDYTTTKSAIEGGADRIELCAALSEGGTTPSFATIKICKENFDVPIFPIVRSRGGDFYYSDEEIEIMLNDISIIKQLGCEGVVAGLLNRDGELPLKKVEKFIEAAYPMEFTFHRAFDRCKDPFKALQQLENLGCQRILTSGQQPTAPEGIKLIKELINEAKNIIIMPGSGVRKVNIKQLATDTGAVEFHSSLRNKSSSNMNFIHPSFSKTDYENPAVKASEVRELKKALLE
ncbi:MAG: copper homeostasis protein CutC [Chitinophagaceae bacterium]